jgi:hypothetical protein
MFQSSYLIDPDTGREATVLAVTKDPGQNLVFGGYITLLIGLVWMLVGRAGQVKTMAVWILMFATVGPSLFCQKQEPVQLSPATASLLAQLPVQHDGRVMPFDTFAREMVKTITGSVKWQGQDPTLTLMRWIDDSPKAASDNNIKIGSADLAMALGWPASTRHASFMQLVMNSAFVQHLHVYNQSMAHGVPVIKTVMAAAELEKRLDAMKGVLFGVDILPMPVPGDPTAAWQGLETTNLVALLGLMDGSRLQGWPSEGKINNEIFYNKLNPVRISWMILLCSLVFSILAWLKKHRWMDIVAFLLVACGFAMMTWGIILRLQAG